MMLVYLGYALIVVGLVMVVLGVLAWLGIIRPAGFRGGPWDFLTALLEKAPWVVVVGLILIYVGAKMTGVPLPP
jgi:hypothetical protein